MTSPPEVSFHISTDDLPERDRVGFWREVIGRSVLRLDVEALSSAPFFADVRLQTLNGSAVALCTTAGLREQRTRELLADGNDMFGLVINLSGPFALSHGGREMVLGPGEATLMTTGEPGTFARPVLGQSLVVSVPRASLAELVPAADDQLSKPIGGSPQALALLAGYLQMINQIDNWPSPELRRAVSGHLRDLVALVIGAPRDAAEVARGRGLRAARYLAIKADIEQSFWRPDLSAATIASRHGMTLRQLQRMFEANETTFSDFLLQRRLGAAHAMLTNAKFADRAVSRIAFEVGFGDLSYFNRTFRRRYGASPSEVRAAAHDRRKNT